MSTAVSIQLAIFVGAVSFGYVAFGGYLLRRYDGVGVESLATFSVLWGASFIVQSAIIYAFAMYGITDGTQLAQLQSAASSSVQSLLFSMDALSGLLTISGIFMWLWFVLRYTRRIDRREKFVIGALGGVTFLIVLTNGLIGAASTFGLLDIEPAVRSSVHQFGAVVEVLGTGMAVGVGIALLYTTATNHQPFREAAVVCLSVAVVLPWLIRYLYQFGLVTDYLVLSTVRIVGLSVGLVGLWLTVTRYDLFDQLPASRAVGRETAFDSSDTAIVVGNNANNISDLNPAARELFSVDSRDVIGEPLDEILPETVEHNELQDTESVVFRLPEGETIVEAVMTAATDDSETAIGRTIVFTDITAERRRQQRIQVLNRVLRHNLRNDLNAAKGYVGVMADGGAETTAHQQKIERILDDLVTIGKKAQETENVLDAEPLSDTGVPLPSLITDALESVTKTYGGVPVSGSVPKSTALRINPVVIGSVIEELIENAIRHTDSPVRVEWDAETTTLRIEDDGPGIPDHEIAVLDNAQETDLEHGSGLGLWLVKWGVDSFGGSVTFDTDETGTRVGIRIPPELIVDTEAS